MFLTFSFSAEWFSRPPNNKIYHSKTAHPHYGRYRDHSSLWAPTLTNRTWTRTKNVNFRGKWVTKELRRKFKCYHHKYIGHSKEWRGLQCEKDARFELIESHSLAREGASKGRERDAEMQTRDASLSQTPWHCLMCTFHNSKEDLVCRMCSNPRAPKALIKCPACSQVSDKYAAFNQCTARSLCFGYAIRQSNTLQNSVDR